MWAVKNKNIGFVSTRIAGSDGVSLETKKWVSVLERNGLKCFFLAGKLDTNPENSLVVEQAHFKHPKIKEINDGCFGKKTRDPKITQKIYSIKDSLKDTIQDFISQFDIDLLIVENALTIPINIPLGMALTEFISENAFPTIAHHHDFFWERKRFLVNAAWELINMAFPPHLPSVRHVVINSSADNQLSLRTGISANIIPNIMDFDSPAPGFDEYNADIRQNLGIKEDEKLILQPTRVVKRKGIEHAIELVSRLEIPSKLVITHDTTDEGHAYERRIRTYSEIMGVEILFVSDIIGNHRGTTSDGRKIYTLWDVYPYADLITYPSTFEGFGNAFLEAIYFRKPIVVNNYTIYSTDIKPRGFKVVEFDDYITKEVVGQTQEILKDIDKCKNMVEHNYEIGRQYYSYQTLELKLKNLIFDCLNV